MMEKRAVEDCQPGKPWLARNSAGGKEAEQPKINQLKTNKVTPEEPPRDQQWGGRQKYSSATGKKGKNRQPSTNNPHRNGPQQKTTKVTKKSQLSNATKRKRPDLRKTKSQG